MSDDTPVGPVLLATRVGRAVAQVIQSTTPEATVTSRGSYLRVRAPGRCRVARAHVEAVLGHPFVLPGDLEQVMAAFQGRLTLDEHTAEWSA